ncbi:YhgE/Pip domain-containing protein [Rarobacter faecitabidus]|uniref:Putative membrane protein n=1 Tax=Rarobacter faecitabidus TaxID=13243 RepID=A0A542ZP16_RARFA|nr:YhgE/Pip domain-containing protein [Rarobacter faecitabidus]TQL62057.1 putative membrane protein [Rarobacter faecitabidus]
MSVAATGTELRRFRRGTVPKLAILALILIPLLYGALYLWAFWDPTGRMDQLPVAIVNADEGSVVGDQPLNAGQQVTDELVSSADLDWKVTTAADADQGVRDGTYYFAVTLPADFSRSIASAAGDDPQGANMYVTYNDANSFLASTLGRSAMEQVQTAVRAKISDQAVEKVLVGLGSARDGFAQASDGAVKLTDGLTDAKSGASSLADGASSAAEGASALADGAQQLDDGAQELKTGTGSLSTGASSLATGAGSVSAGADTLHSSLGKLSAGGVKVNDGAATLAKGSKTLAAGATQASSGASDLADGSKKLATGATSLQDGAVKTQQGAEQLRKATATLSGAFTAKSGILAGADSAAAGAQQLATGLAAAQDQVDALPDTISDLAQLIAANDQALAQAGLPAAHPLRVKNAAALTELQQMAGSDLADNYDQAVAGAQALASKDSGLPYLAAALHTASDGVEAVEAQLTPSGGAANSSTPASPTPASPTLRDGIDGVADGATTLAEGTTTLSSGAKSLAAGTSKVADGADSVSSGASTLKSGTKSLASGAKKATTGAGDLADGASKVADGAGTLKSGSAKLDSGAKKLADGTASATDGAGQLADGTKQLADGAGTLSSGLTDATDGAGTLAKKLSEGADQIPADDATLRAQRATAIAAPVTVNSNDIAQAEGFGEGFAPFFISLALFVGSLITWLLLRPVPPRMLAAPVSGWRIAFGGYLPAAAIGLAQVLVMLTVIHFGLGLEMANAVGVVAFTALIAAAFVALQQMFIALAGPAVGKVIILAFLMLQLASSGGTYPVQTTAGFFQVLHPWLPMSYSVTGLRQLITGGADGRLVTSVIYLAGLLLVSLAVTAWRSGRMRTWSLERLHPAISM